MEYTKMVSTKLEKIDKNEVAKKCLVRKNWSKSWTIVEYEGFTITARLIRIDTEKGSGTIGLSGTFVPKQGDSRVAVAISSYNIANFDFPLFRKDFTQKAFNEKLVTTADSLICSRFADDTIWKTPRYKVADYMDRQNETTSKAVAKEYCASHNIQEENIKQTIECEFNGKYNKSYSIGVELAFDKYIFADVLYALSCWLGLEDKQKTYKELMGYDWKTALSNTKFDSEVQDEDEDEATESNPEVAPVVG